MLIALLLVALILCLVNLTLSILWFVGKWNKPWWLLGVQIVLLAVTALVDYLARGLHA